MIMKHSYVFLADGFEEIEAVTPVDVLRRAGLDVKTVSISDSHVVTGAHGVKYTADMLMEEVTSEDIQWLILPGGMPGAENLYKCRRLCDMLRKHVAADGNCARFAPPPEWCWVSLGCLTARRLPVIPVLKACWEKNASTCLCLWFLPGMWLQATALPPLFHSRLR